MKIADRLFSSIGQDTLDALFWTAVEAPEKRSILMILLHFGLASLYVCIFLPAFVEHPPPCITAQC